MKQNVADSLPEKFRRNLVYRKETYPLTNKVITRLIPYWVMILFFSAFGAMLGTSFGGALGSLLGGLVAFMTIVTLSYVSFRLADRIQAGPRQNSNAPPSIDPTPSLIYYILWFQLVCGCAAFAALFTAELQVPIKVFLGLAFILITAYPEFQDYAVGRRDELHEQLVSAQFGAIEKLIKGETVDYKLINERLHIRRVLNTAAENSSWGLVPIIHVGKYAVWVGGGWVISRLIA